MGDIGTHAANLAEYISGQKIDKLCADLNIMVEGRLLDDDGAVLGQTSGDRGLPRGDPAGERDERHPATSSH